MAAVTTCSDFGAPPQNKVSHCVSTVSPPICHEVMGPDAKILVFCPMTGSNSLLGREGRQLDTNKLTQYCQISLQEARNLDLLWEI